MANLTKLCLGAALALSLTGVAFADTTTTTTAPAASGSSDSAASGSTDAGTADATKSADANTPAPTADTVVATVNGTKITLGNVIALRGQLPPQYQQLPDEVLFKGIVDQLVQQTLLQQSVDGKLTKEDQLAYDNAKRAFLAGVALSNVSDQAVTDDALKAAYDKEYANQQPGTEYHAAHILVPTEKEAKDIKAQLDKGADFAALAKKDSKDGSAANGGDLGWFGEGMMVEPFQDAVEKLKPGQVSDPVKTQFGWHIIKLEGTRPAKAPSMDEVKDKLSQEIEKKAVADKIAELTKGAKITRDDKGIDPSVLQDQSLLGK